MDKAKLKQTLSEIEKQHGAGTVFRGGSNRRLDVKAIPTGVLPFDIATGIGGLPRGRVVEIYGPESAGKTTLTLHTIASAQREKGVAVFIDAEHALNPEYAKKLGVDVDNLLISQPDCGEQALEVTDSFVRSGQIDIIVIDSVAALVPRKELEGEMGDAQMGSHARLMSQAMRKLCGNVGKTQTCVVFINQVREKVGVMYGNPEVTTGGRALKFFASMRVRVSIAEVIKEGQAKVGTRNKMEVVKSKVAAPYKFCLVEQIYGLGFDPITNTLLSALELGVIARSGAWYSYKDERIANGEANTIARLKELPELAAKIISETRELAMTKPAETKETVEVPEENETA